MAELSNRYTKILSDIDSHISNKDEKKYVEKKIMELSSIYLELLDRLTKINNEKISEVERKQEKLVEKVEDIQETINAIKNDIYEYDGYDFEIVCPYCNFEFVTEINDDHKKEVKCPECKNVIELDWNDKNTNKKDKTMKNIDEDDEF